jgi:IS30 family transposase
MKNDNLNKGKHLSLEDRYYIEEALNQKCSLKQIAKNLMKDTTTISKEIRRNRIVSSQTKQAEYISCTNKKDCTKKHICDKSCDQLCKKCIILTVIGVVQIMSQQSAVILDNSLMYVMDVSVYPYAI